MKQQFTFKSIFLFLFLGIISTTTYASHYYGSEITYNCLGSNQYEIILTTYTDCNSIGSPNSLTVNFSSATCTDFNQSLSLASGFPMDITPVCATQATSCNGGSGSIGISKYEYRGTVTLTGSCIDWLVSYNSCCRNNAITNVANPGSQSHFISASLNDGNLCNSSPKFIDEEPIKFGCTNSTMFVNVGATDADGDSLVYSLVAAQGSGGAALAYNVGHSATSPFTGNVTLNGSTGALEITANTAQTGHLVVQVNEYRSGALISEVRREVVYFFQNCTNSQPIVNQANGIAVNQGTIQFSVVAGTAWTAVLGTDDTEVNAGTQTLTATWGTLPGSATGSGSTTPTLNWTPTSNDVGTHYINLTVQDDACPIIGLNSYVVVVHVMPFSVGNTSSNVSATMAAGTTGDICFDLSNLTNPIASVIPLGNDFNNAEEIVTVKYASQNLSQQELQQKIASYKLEHSFIGITGRAIEPSIKPLGYDWKIGIAIVSSFAAREVFVGTLATIYSVENEDVDTITNRMAKDTNRITGGKLFTLASGISLLLFYAFAMQCMSTLAIVKRETNSWKWPVLQLVIMTAFAYIVALIAFQVFK